MRRFVAVVVDPSGPLAHSSWLVVDLRGDDFTAASSHDSDLRGCPLSTGERVFLTDNKRSQADTTRIGAIDPDSGAPEIVYDLGEALPGNVESICGTDDVLFLSDGDHLARLDLSSGDASSVDLAEVEPTAGTRPAVKGCAIVEGLVYLAVGSFVIALPVGGPGFPSWREARFVDLGEPVWSIALVGERDLVISGASHLFRLDLSDGSDPTAIATHAPGFHQDLVGLGEHFVGRTWHSFPYLCVDPYACEAVFDVVDIHDGSESPVLYRCRTDFLTVADAGWGQVVLTQIEDSPRLALLDITSGALLAQADFPISCIAPVPAP